MTKIQEYSYPAQKDVQLAYGLTNVNLDEGRRTFDTCYEISKVFNRELYSSSKSYNSKVSRYLNYFKSNNLYIKEIETEDEKAKVYELYDEWNAAKIQADIENPNHYREHESRYKRCLDFAFAKKLETGGVLGMFNSENKLLSYQMYITKENWYYAAALASTKTDHPRLANIAIVNFLDYVKNVKGFDFFNFGECGGDKNLLFFKETFPNFRIYYGKLNVTFSRSTSKDVDKIVSFMQKYSTPENPFPTDYMPKSIEDGNVLKALVNDELVGMVELRNKDGKNLVTNLIVAEEYQRQGLARLLLQNLSVDNFEIWCYKSNEKAVNFYKGLSQMKMIGESTEAAGPVYLYKYN